ncbi:hypothetical protein [Nonomuraea turkmeniaca]|nr:hypothetical protein [Nonomuraea turkmeniaca]
MTALRFAARLSAWSLAWAVHRVLSALCPADVHDVFPEEDR